MAIHPSTPRPSTERLRRTAKRLLLAIRAGEPDALARYLAVWPGESPREHATLQRVHHVLAQEIAPGGWSGYVEAEANSQHPLTRMIALHRAGTNQAVNAFDRFPLTVVSGQSGMGKSVLVGCAAMKTCIKDRRPVAIVDPAGGSFTWSGHVLRTSGAPHAGWSVHIVEAPDDPDHGWTAALDAAVQALLQAGATGKRRGILVCDEAWRSSIFVDWSALIQRIMGFADLVVIVQSPSDVDLIRARPLLQHGPWRSIALHHAEQEDPVYVDLLGYSPSIMPSSCQTFRGHRSDPVAAESAVAVVTDSISRSSCPFADAVVTDSISRSAGRVRAMLFPMGRWTCSSGQDDVALRSTVSKRLPHLSAWEVVDRLGQPLISMMSSPSDLSAALTDPVMVQGILQNLSSTVRLVTARPTQGRSGEAS